MDYIENLEFETLKYLRSKLPCMELILDEILQRKKKPTCEFESIAIETTKEKRRKGIKNENSISFLQDTFK